MTAFSKTVTNSLRTFGGGPSSLWHSYNWNAFKWGEGTATVPHQVRHLITTSFSPLSSMLGFRVVHLLTNQAFAPLSSVNFRFARVVVNALSTDSGVPDQFVQDPNGYFKVFPEGVTNAHLQSVPSWAENDPASQPWASAATGTTVWS